MPAPCDVVGRIDRRYDKDWYRLDAKKGEVFYLELFADRIGSGMDTYFVVKPATSAPGTKAAAGEDQDDDPDALHPLQFLSRSFDPAPMKFVAPADGPFAVMVGSRESNVNFGPRCGYRLRIAKPAPDFRAVVMPTASVSTSQATPVGPARCEAGHADRPQRTVPGGRRTRPSATAPP